MVSLYSQKYNLSIKVSYKWSRDTFKVLSTSNHHPFCNGWRYISFRWFFPDRGLELFVSFIVICMWAFFIQHTKYFLIVFFLKYLPISGNHPYYWEANSSSDTALSILMNLCFTQSVRSVLKEVDTFRALVHIAEYSANVLHGTRNPVEEAQMTSQCIKAVRLLLYSSCTKNWDFLTTLMFRSRIAHGSLLSCRFGGSFWTAK